MTEKNEMANLVEKLASLEHKQWMAWSKAIAQSDEPIGARNARWEKLWIPYTDLTEEEKKADRYWVRKTIKLLENSPSIKITE